MTYNTRRLFLQLFAGAPAGGGGGSGEVGAGAAATGEGNADAAQQLRAMGVPEGKIARYAKAYNKRANEAAAPRQAAGRAEEGSRQAAAAETAQTEEVRQTAHKYDWDEVMKDPEMNRRMQQTVKAGKKKLQAALDALSPALKAIAQEHGMDPENMDYVTLSRHMTGQYAQKASQAGLPEEAIVQMDQQQRLTEEQLNRQHIEGLIRQGERLKDVFPGFDLWKEMENPRFRRLTARGVNVSVEDAYHLIHRRELELAQAQIVDRKATQRVQNTIRAGAARPTEGGASSQAPTVTSVDWKHATPEQLRAQAKAIRLAAARGKKLGPGQ